MSPARDRDCDYLGLTDDQHAALTGFTGRAVRALAHLREAWCGADPSNRPGIERAIREVIGTRSMSEAGERRIAARVLTCGLDDGLAQRILDSVGVLSRHPDQGRRS